MKKSVIFVALLAWMFFVSCKNATDVKPEEPTTETIMEEQVDSVTTDSIKADKVAPMETKEDSLTKK